ncbi:transglycosylase SLT domain-containing protein [Archangium violaceum]|uniref:lytic transglycosylase domain-containing protein n=1 Tax=Archangium violaceum TaxID=83451 RepID=UPI00194FCD9F|nr:transglycosylase SLT domain-containing protein [Archangium violaceum]QRN93278.1 transglycosylase SLT domain-containing protein [Archangium violaceum]
MKAFVPLLAAAAAATSLAFTQAPPTEEPSAAPQAQTQNAPSEAQLSPPPDSEKVLVPPGYVEVLNPAFPDPPPPAPVQPRVFKGRSYGLDDLSPYFAEGKRKEAKEAFDKGFYTRARELLEKEGNSLPVRYLRALSAVRAGDDKRAAEEMTALAEDYPALRDRCLTHAGVALESLGRFSDAAVLLAQVPDSSRLYADARLALGRVLRKAKDTEAALAALAPLASRTSPSWGRNVGAEALLASADIAAEKKDKTREREFLWRLWAWHPLTPLAKQAEARLKGQQAPLEMKVVRGEQLIELNRNRQGLDVLEPLLPKLKLPDALACRAHFAYGKGQRKERQHTRAIAALTPVVDQCKERDLLPRALYVLGSSRSIVDQVRGTDTYERLAREFPEHSFADDALFYAADLYVKTGRLELAAQRLQELAKLYPQGDFLGEALFKDFWISRTLKAKDGGLSSLVEIEKRFADADETYDFERARYWRARTLQDRGDAKGAADLFEQLAVEHPATYYGLMARAMLGSLEPARLKRVEPQLDFTRQERRDPWPMHAGAMEKDPHFTAAVELMRLGFPEAVSSELLAVNRSNLPPENVRLLVLMLARAGDERAAHAVARVALRRDLSGRITPETRPVWEVAYPNAFRELIEKHTSAAGVEPDLLQALMREESALDPKALSWAGALGLTQLMPSTAQAVARQLKLKKVTNQSLLEPDVNIKLGAHYLGSLVKRFSGHTPFAVGGYNAGPLAIDRWRADRPGMPLDAWVEEVPIAETRGYIKRVLRSYNTYQLLYGRPAKAPAVQASR